MNHVGHFFSAVGYFFVLAGQACSAPFLFPLPSLFCIGTLGVAWWAALLDPRVWQRRSLWLLVPFGLPFLILAYGVVFNHAGPSSTTPEWHERWLGYLILAPIPIAGLLLATIPVYPLITLGLSIFAWGLSCCAGIVSSMSVTNNWL